MKTDILAKVMERYPLHSGRCVAIIDGDLVAEGKDRLEAFRNARKRYPGKKIAIFYMPTEEEMVPLL